MGTLFFFPFDDLLIYKYPPCGKFVKSMPLSLPFYSKDKADKVVLPVVDDASNDTAHFFTQLRGHTVRLPRKLVGNKGAKGFPENVCFPNLFLPLFVFYQVR